MSKTYSIIVTRDTTESCVVVVEATSEEEAREEALVASRDPDRVWEQDDTPNASKQHYVTNVEEV